MTSDDAELSARAVSSVAHSIFPPDAGGGHDAAGGRVESPTEAVMGLTVGLCRIAGSLESVAEAIRPTRKD